MKTKCLKTALTVALLAAVLSRGTNLYATAPGASFNPGVASSGGNPLQTVAFSDTAEAGMLRRAYVILATGDHDYKGHRVKAMHQIEAAADLLGMNIRADAKDRQPQVLSDAKLREAQGLLQNVLGAAEVKSQKHISKHIVQAINQLSVALSIR